MTRVRSGGVGPTCKNRAMADSESSDVLANLPAGRPTRRSARRGSASAPEASTGAAEGAAAAAGTTTAAKKPAAKKAAAKKAAAKPTVKKKAAAAKPAAKKTAAAAKPAAKKKAAAAKQPAAKRAAARKAPASRPAPTPLAGATADTAASATPARRPRIATPPEGRRADYSAGNAKHRARKVTTNRPWLPSSGFVLPEDKEQNQLTAALGGFGAALADVARLSFGLAQSIAVRRREIEAPESAELTTED